MKRILKFEAPRRNGWSTLRMPKNTRIVLVDFDRDGRLCMWGELPYVGVTEDENRTFATYLTGDIINPDFVYVGSAVGADVAHHVMEHKP